MASNKICFHVEMLTFNVFQLTQKAIHIKKMAHKHFYIEVFLNLLLFFSVFVNEMQIENYAEDKQKWFG